MSVGVGIFFGVFSFAGIEMMKCSEDMVIVVPENELVSFYPYLGILQCTLY